MPTKLIKSPFGPTQLIKWPDSGLTFTAHVGLWAGPLSVFLEPGRASICLSHEHPHSFSQIKLPSFFHGVIRKGLLNEAIFSDSSNVSNLFS